MLHNWGRFKIVLAKSNKFSKNGHDGLGRPKGTGKTKETLESEYKGVLRELRRGTSVRRTAKLCDVSTFTVQKLKKEFAL